MQERLLKSSCAYLDFSPEVLHDQLPVARTIDAEWVKAELFHGQHQVIHPAEHLVDLLGFACHCLQLWAKNVAELLLNLQTTIQPSHT